MGVPHWCCVIDFLVYRQLAHPTLIVLWDIRQRSASDLRVNNSSQFIQAMAAELQRDSPLFDQVVPIEVISENGATRNTQLTFRVIPGARTLPGSNQPEKLFRFEFSDEASPYFLYFLDIGESDFPNIKKDQNILVDFPQFPANVIRLVELSCQQQHRYEHNNSSDAAAGSMPAMGNSAYMTRLDTTQPPQFTIFETNHFNQVPRITLRVTAGNDSYVKQFLSSRLFYANQESDKLRQNVQQMKDNAFRTEQEKRELESELQRLRSHYDVDIQTLRSQHASEMASQRGAAMDELAQTKSFLVQQIKDHRQQLESTRSTMQLKYDNLESEHDGSLDICDYFNVVC
jgi:spindle assembly abnormal protein 6